MKVLIKNIKNKWEISKGRIYTKLYLNNKLFRVWKNEDIESTLKTNDIEKQKEYFKNNLID